MSIPKSNNPEQQETPVRDAEFEKKMTAAVERVKQLVNSTQDEVNRVEKNKLHALRESGREITSVMADLGTSEKKGVIMRFAQETGHDASFFYMCTNFYERLTDDQYAKAVEKGLNVGVVKVLVTIKDEKLLEKAIKKAIEEGLSASDLMEFTGKKGARTKAVAARSRANAAAKSPLQVYVKANDRLRLFSESVDECTDAYNRLVSCKDEDTRQRTVDQILQYRDGIKSMVNSAKAFIAYTNGLEAKAGKVAKQ